MSKGIIKRKNTLKRQFIGQLQKELDRVIAENQALKQDPQGAIAPFMKRLEELSNVNDRLSALVCGLIRTYGEDDKVMLDEALMTSFDKKRLVISAAIDPEGQDMPVGRIRFQFEVKEPTPQTTPTPSPILTEALENQVFGRKLRRKGN